MERHRNESIERVLKAAGVFFTGFRVWPGSKVVPAIDRDLSTPEHRAVAQPGEFSPRPYYDAESDALFFFARDVQSYAKRLNSTLTLYLSVEDDTLVGCKVKSVQHILKHMKRLKQNYGVAVLDRKMKLGILLEFALVAPPVDPAILTYEEDMRKFGDVEIDERELEPIGS